MEKKRTIVNNLPENYIKVASGLGEAAPTALAVVPVLFQDEVTGILELASLEPFTDLHLSYMDMFVESLSVNLETVKSREALADALAQSQAFSEELQVQQEELTSANEELEEQTQMLEHSQAQLEAQQEELRVTNEELEEMNRSLQLQHEKVDQARQEIEIKAKQLAIASKYKSEFLANMSHELRTPLNSVLLLSRILAMNKDNTLTDKQIESANIIYNSGNDLLSLIDEILDLSKIEAGKMTIHNENVALKDLELGIRNNFQHIADDKNLTLEIELEQDLPPNINTDRKRLDQIIKNLLSNAFKFTSQGSITVSFRRPMPGSLLSSKLEYEKMIAITVQDTGIGIPEDKQKVIFEAFQQADQGTTRAYGGTGLGLTISRELAQILGGEIRLKSEPGKGSTFTLYLPMGKPGKITALLDSGKEKEPDVKEQEPEPAKETTSQLISDDRYSIEPNDSIILAIEDDPAFADMLIDQCHQKGFKTIITTSGEEGLKLATQTKPDAIILDLRLPGMDGWKVLETLKDNPKTRHIPVHIISIKDVTLDAIRKGAVGQLTKPVTREALEEAFGKLETIFNKQIKELLVVEDDTKLRNGLVKLFHDSDIHIDQAATGNEAINAIRSRTYDCVILDLGLPDMTGFQVLRRLEANEKLELPPVIVYTGQELTREEEADLRRYAESIIIKGTKSEERLLSEVSLFLHRVVGITPERKRKMITNLYESENIFQDKMILVVDDDMRNVFALSRLMEEKGIKIFKAENGEKALKILDKEPNIDLVLMDVMMPVMDGYDAMRQIRAQARFEQLPIIALTAKAMKQDRDLCLAAGANDYLTKPIDTNRLFSMMRVWLYR
jgi:CheY-like chemotaxis protein/signal transduction histidine kinase